MGHWEEIDKPWYEVKIINCSLCGRMIARSLWVTEEPERRIFCSEKCEHLATRRKSYDAES